MISSIKIVRGDKFNPYYNLAQEEYLTTTVNTGELIIYLWQNKHTIVIGRNQNAWQECKVEEFIQDGGKIARRLSGGGAVYHDLGNLNFTFCVRKEDYDINKQLDVILMAVRSLGINAEKTGRNDITIGKKKFSGNAFYKKGDYCYHHGTLLLAVDSEQMLKFLNVDKAKLKSKGVNSVKSRVTNLREYNENITVELMCEQIKIAAQKIYNCPINNYILNAIDKVKINKLMTKFNNWNWIFGRKIKFTNHLKQRFAWGSVEFYIYVNEGRVKDIEIYSDMMEQNFILLLKKELKDCLYIKGKLIERIENLTKNEMMRKDLVNLIQDDL